MPPPLVVFLLPGYGLFLFGKRMQNSADGAGTCIQFCKVCDNFICKSSLFQIQTEDRTILQYRNNGGSQL